MKYSADIMNGHLRLDDLPDHRVRQLEQICDVVMVSDLKCKTIALYKGLTVDTKILAPIKDASDPHPPMERQDTAPFITFDA